MEKFIVAAALVMCAIGPAHAGCYIANYTNGIPNEVCTPDDGAAVNVHKYAAIAVSDSTVLSGSSHGQNLRAEAERLALALCSARAPDCKIQAWADNQCAALATSKPDNYWTTDTAPTRAEASTKALTECRDGQGQNCIIQASPCASDDPKWPSPLPLPPAGQAGNVDPNIVGTWVLSMNPGRWVWEIGPNGTYEFHSEAPDGVASHAGTLSAKDGQWSMQATTGYTDGGTYNYQPSGNLVATGRLGTGTWHHIANEINN